MGFQELDWSDLGPLNKYDNNAPLAVIAYEPKYKLATQLLCALMEREEISSRALLITGEVIRMNPAHYTVWDYRLKILEKIGAEIIPKDSWMVKDVQAKIVEDGPWLDQTTLDSAKNYQSWNYRQYLEVKGSVEFYRGELLIVRCVLDDDCKNFHAWSHLKWLSIQAGSIFSTEAQLQFSEDFIEADVRNNSAWSYRFFVFSNNPKLLQGEQFDREVDYVKEKINLAPQNESPWNYLRGLYDKYRKPEDICQLEEFCKSHQYKPESDNVLRDSKSIFALELLEFIYKQKGQYELANNVIDELCRHVPWRQGYWNYLRSQKAC